MIKMKVKIGLKKALEKMVKKELVGLNWNNVKFYISNDGIKFYDLSEYQEEQIKKWFSG
jgi:uncharacterized protein YigE (DUF2233 family)